MKKFRIAIVGAGGVGGNLGAYLAKNNEDVVLIDAWPAHVDAMRKSGLTHRGQTAAENFKVAVNALHISDVQSLVQAPPLDVVFLGVKSYDTVWATEMIKPYMAANGVVVSLQNGINEERIAKIVGWGRTIGCVVSATGAELVEPGVVQRNTALSDANHPCYRMGELHGRITPRLQRLVDLVQCRDHAVATTNIWGERWSKVCVNAMRNPVASATGRAANENDLDPQVRSLNIRLAAESVEVGLALGYDLVSFYRMEPSVVRAAGQGDTTAFKSCEDTLLNLAKTRSADQRPSMAQDILKGRRTEIDFINGVVVAEGKRAGIATPVNEKIIEIVHRLERGSAKPSPSLIAGI